MSSLQTSPQPIFTEQEQQVWQALVISERSPLETIPEDLSAENVWLYLNVVCKGLTRAQQAVSRLKPFFGRILLLVQKHPHLYEQHGYKTFSDFITSGVPALFGISRPEAWNCIRVAEQINFLPSGKMEELGFSKLNLLAKAIKNSTQDGMAIEMVQKKRDEWVAIAEGNITVKQFGEIIATKQQGNDGENETVALILYVSTDVKKRWHDFVRTPEIQAYCGSESEGAILSRLMDECELEWTTKEHDAGRG